MVRKTRKAGSKPLTIPQLRKRFEQLDTFLKSKVARLEGEKAVEAFRSEWKKLFGKSVSAEAARDYLAFVREQKTQKGGGALPEGAPIDQMLRAGTDTPYGSFPPYVDGGFGFANHDSFIQDCGKPNPFPVPPAGLGFNEVGKALTGGARRRGAHAQTRRRRQPTKSASALAGQRGGGIGSAIDEAFQRPFMASIPPSMLTKAQMEFKGIEMPSSKPENNPLSFTVPPTVLNIKIANP